MKQIRRGIFETNSSSMHSISIIRKNPANNGEIPKNKLITEEDFSGVSVGDVTELGKLMFCIKLIFSILEDSSDDYNDELDDLHKKNTIKIINEVLDISCKSQIDFNRFDICDFSDMYVEKLPLDVLKEFVMDELGKEIGDDILEEENLKIVILALTRIIFSPDIITIDNAIC